MDFTDCKSIKKIAIDMDGITLLNNFLEEAFYGYLFNRTY